MTRTRTNSASLGLKAHNLPYWVTYAFIAVTILVINLFTDALRYADTETYISFLNSLVYFPRDSWKYFEVFSNIYLLIAFWLMQSDVSGVVLAHYALTLGFVLGLRFVFPPNKSSWAALLFTCAIVGPLLAFVTIRATPAYFLVAVAAQLAMNRRISAWVFLVIAAMFHVSALLAAIPMAILYFDRNLPKLFRTGRSRKFYSFVIITAVLFGAALPQLSANIADLIQVIPVISKYNIYIVSSTSDTKIEHYLFFGFISSLTIIFMLVQTNQSAKLTSYVMVSFIMYVVMFFSASPVAAFRQTPFWVIPMIAVLPWARVGVNRLTASLFILLCIILFVFQFQQVYL